MLMSYGYPFSVDGEDMSEEFQNHCRVLFPETTHVIKILFSGAATKDGVESLLPTDQGLFTVYSTGKRKGSTSKMKSNYILGLADLGYYKNNSWEAFPSAYL